MSDEQPKASNFYELRYDLGNGRNISINGSFYDNQTRDQKYASLQETVAIVERQRASLEIPLLELQVKQLEKNRDDLPQILENEIGPLISLLDNLYAQQKSLKGRDRQPNIESQITSHTAAKEARLKKHKQDLAGIEVGLIEARDTIAKRRRFVETGIEE